jgi:hypothetical protein
MTSTGALKRPARTTETNKRQGRAGQTSCTNVHKANLGSQLSIFDTALARTTCPNEFTRAPSNDPPERPTRTTRPKEFTRAPSNDRAQTTNLERPNLAFLIRAHMSARANDPPERPTRTSSHGRPQTILPPERRKRTDKGEPGKRAARACTKPTSGHNLAFLIRARQRPARTNSTGRPQTTRPNDRNEASNGSRANEPPERPTRTTCPNEFTRVPSNDPPERVHRAPSPRTTKRIDKGEPGKRAARTCTKPTSGHNLAFLIRPSPERPARTSSTGRPRTTRPNEFTRAPSNDPPERPTRTTRPNEFTRAPSNDPPERVHTGAVKRPARTSSHGRPQTTARTSSHGRPQTTRPNEFTRAPSNDPPERPEFHGCPQTTRPNEFTQAPSNDPPSHGHPQTTRPNDPSERVHTGALKRPARTSSHGHPQTTRPNEFTRAPSNDLPERPTRTTRPNEFTRAPSNDPPERVHTGALKRPARTSSHGIPQTTRPNDPPERPARTSSHGRPQTTRPNDPPERPARTSSHGHPQTTRPNDFSWAPERPKRTDKGEPGKRAARTCTKPTSGHNLAFLIRPSPERVPGPLKRPTRTSSHGRPQTTRPNDPPERPARSSSHGRPQTTRPNDPPERVHTGALKQPARTILHGRTNDRNEPTRESRANELHERAQSQPRVTT